MKQKALWISDSNDVKELNKLLEEEWIIKFTESQHVSTSVASPNSYSSDRTYGNVLVILERDTEKYRQFVLKGLQERAKRCANVLDCEKCTCIPANCENYKERNFRCVGDQNIRNMCRFWCNPPQPIDDRNKP